MTDQPADQAAAAWLRRLRWSLDSLPAADRDEIVAEAAAHFADAGAAGRDVAAVIAGFGTPEAYARRYLDEAELARALGSQSAGDLAGVVARRLHRSLIAAVAGLAVLALTLAAFVAVTLVVMEIQDPARTGLWIGPTVRFIGQIDDPAIAHDLLGGWMLPAAAGVIGAAFVLGRLALLAAVRALARR